MYEKNIYFLLKFMFLGKIGRPEKKLKFLPSSFAEKTTPDIHQFSP